MNLPPDPEQMNDARAEWALQSIELFQQLTGTDDCDAVGDLIADILHMCDRHQERFGEAIPMIKRGMRAYADEIEAAPIKWATE